MSTAGNSNVIQKLAELFLKKSEDGGYEVDEN